jgi:hypothetical protein
VLRIDEVRDGHWPVVGVYVGERMAVDRGLFVSYSVRMDDIADWVPRVLDRSLIAEAQP